LQQKSDQCMNAPAMKNRPILPMLALLLTACSTMQQTGQMRDGVYEKPTGEALASASPVNEPTKQADDYYDPDQASEFSRGYYDMAYNDPYYYNYGRFGWGMGLGYGTGWGSPYGSSYWGMSQSWGSPYYDPWGPPYGYGGWGAPYGYPYGGYGGWCDPWHSGYYGNPYYNGYGYYGYGGPCYGCYQPVMVYTNTIVTHRPTLGSGGNGGGSGGDPTPTFAPVGPMSLLSTTPSRSLSSMSDFSARPAYPTHGSRPMEPSRQSQTRPSYDHQQSGERHDRGWNSGGGSTPSRSGSGGDGGSRPSTGHRPR
jgi:hypothetical protein